MPDKLTPTPNSLPVASSATASVSASKPPATPAEVSGEPELSKLAKQVTILNAVVAALVRAFPTDELGTHDRLIQAVGEIEGTVEAKTGALNLIRSAGVHKNA